MTQDEMRELYELYLMGALEEPELSELRAELARQHPEADLRQAAAHVAALAALPDPVEPPARLRKRVLASVGVEQKAWTWMPAWLAASAAALVAVGWFGWQQTRRADETTAALTEARQQIARQGAELTRASEILTMLNAPETIVRVSSEGAAKPPQGKVFLHPRQGVLLIASNLPPAPAGKIYEMWVIPAGQKPVPAGLFQTEANGTALHFQRGPVDINATGMIAVTLENAGGAEQPTSTPIIVAPVRRG